MLSRENMHKLDSQAPGCIPQYKPLNCTCKLYSLRIDRSLIYRCLGTGTIQNQNAGWDAFALPRWKLFIGIAFYLLDETFIEFFSFGWEAWKSLKALEKERLNHQWLKKNQAEHTGKRLGNRLSSENSWHDYSHRFLFNSNSWYHPDRRNSGVWCHTTCATST